MEGSSGREELHQDGHKRRRVNVVSLTRQRAHRERLVAALAADGRTNAQVAAELHVNLHTVKSQMRSVLRKLEIDSRWQIDRSRHLTVM